ncbi:MAG: hypothetical protein AAGA42_02385 [Actinomycetota bacterium]
MSVEWASESEVCPVLSRDRHHVRNVRRLVRRPRPEFYDRENESDVESSADGIDGSVGRLADGRRSTSPPELRGSSAERRGDVKGELPLPGCSGTDGSSLPGGAACYAALGTHSGGVDLESRRITGDSLTSVVPVVPSARPTGAAEVAPRGREVVVLELWQAEIVANVLRAVDAGEVLPPSACREARAMVEHPSSRPSA